MLTEGQIKYLATIPDDKKMVIKPWSQNAMDFAQELIAKIKATQPELEVELIGSLPLHIAGQEDIDISIYCAKSEQGKYIDSLSKLFGKPKKRGDNAVWWYFEKDNIAADIWLTDPTADATKAQRQVFTLLQNNPDLLKEYEEIKLRAANQTYKEYQKKKYEFYNRILGITE